METIIKVRENEFLPLLDRDKVLVDVKLVFSEQIEMLRDLTNYGTNLIPRCYGSSDRQLKDIVVIAILLRQVVAMLDGVEVLVSNGAIHAAALQARALIEASAYIDWILSADGEKKATYYYVHNMRRQRRWAQRFQQGSPEATAFTALVSDLPALRDPNAIAEATKSLADADRVLSQPVFAVVSQDFDKNAIKGGKGDRSWYVPLGIRSVSRLLRTVGMPGEYTVFYGNFSETMHSSNFTQHARMEKGTITFENIRHLSEFGSLFGISATAALRTYRIVLKNYRPGELPAFARKYNENWQKAFREVPAIKYDVAAKIPAL